MTTAIQSRAPRVMDAANFSIYTPIHSKYVPNPKSLNDILSEEFGEGGFEIEVCPLLTVPPISYNYKTDKVADAP